MWTHSVCRVGVMFLVLVADVSLQARGEDPPVVRTRQGAVRGRHQTSSSGRPLLAFYNLPFARPPVGSLRFRDPEPPEKWVHIRDATLRGSDCVQYDEFFLGSGLTGSEDCLYLNVYTPQISPSSRLPVMVWIYGGGFIFGGGSTYGPDYLLNHDVVLVTINYRLGTFGFLSTEDDAASGNFGFKDQVAALRWVKENIAAFGGDPNRVTIFGESAGSVSVHLHALSPLSKGLFHRVIMESGSALIRWAIARRGESLQKARKMASVLGCPTEPNLVMVECLRNVDDDKLLRVGNSLKNLGMSDEMPFQPVVDAKMQSSFLPDHPLNLEPNEVDWIIGVNENEGGIVTAGIYGNSSTRKELEDNFNSIIPKTFHFDNAQKADFIIEKIREFYFPSGSFSLKGMTDLYSDFMLWSSNEAVRRYKKTATVFYYYFTYRGKYRTADPFRKIDFDFGAGHTDELFYIFPKNPFYPANYELADEDMKMVDTMTKLWTNFAKTGNPTPDGTSLIWPKVTSDDEPEHLEIGQELHARKGLETKRIEFWRSLAPLMGLGTGESLREEL